MAEQKEKRVVKWSSACGAAKPVIHNNLIACKMQMQDLWWWEIIKNNMGVKAESGKDKSCQTATVKWN